jgi:2-oxo-4-hydroxy-4-carboxy-5-ureidoimidazoline decarboxylase
MSWLRRDHPKVRRPSPRRPVGELRLCRSAIDATTGGIMAEEPLARFNALPPDEAEAELLACCAAPSWAAAVVAGRPYADSASVLAASADAFARMPAADLSAAIAAHPRIGDRGTGDSAGPAASSRDAAGRGGPSRGPAGHEGHFHPDLSGEGAPHARAGDMPAGESRDGEWSRQEQAGVAGASADTLAALAAGNRAYEERFGQVFLICATGLSAAEMLATLRTRLGNDPDTEAKIVREELGKITGLRLRKLLGGDRT